MQQKCLQYWPDRLQDSISGGTFTITLTSVLPFADYRIRTLEIKNVSSYYYYFIFIIQLYNTDDDETEMRWNQNRECQCRLSWRTDDNTAISLRNTYSHITKQNKTTTKTTHRRVKLKSCLNACSRVVTNTFDRDRDSGKSTHRWGQNGQWSSPRNTCGVCI